MVMFQSSHLWHLTVVCQVTTPPFLTDEIVLWNSEPEIPGRFPWRSPMTSGRSPKPALRSASSVSAATSRSPKSPNVNTRMSKFSNMSSMSAVSGDSSTVSLGLKFVLTISCVRGCWMLNIRDSLLFAQLSRLEQVHKPTDVLERAHSISVWWKKKTSKRVIKRAFHIIAYYCLHLSFVNVVPWAYVVATFIHSSFNLSKELKLYPFWLHLLNCEFDSLN